VLAEKGKAVLERPGQSLVFMTPGGERLQISVRSIASGNVVSLDIVSVAS
jgi:hypothetical protein